jgi:hypothetical protein
MNNSQTREPPPVGCPRLLIEYILSDSHTMEDFSICNLKNLHAVITKDPLHRVCYSDYLFIYLFIYINLFIALCLCVYFLCETCFLFVFSFWSAQHRGFATSTFKHTACRFCSSCYQRPHWHTAYWNWFSASYRYYIILQRYFSRGCTLNPLPAAVVCKLPCHPMGGVVQMPICQ